MNTEHPFSLFKELLAKFPTLLRASGSAANADTAPDVLVLARNGFAQYAPLDNWEHFHEVFIRERLESDLSAESLDWYDECAEAVRLYSCLIMGALLGKYSIREINDTEFALADAHLPAFIADSNEQICLLWQEVQISET